MHTSVTTTLPPRDSSRIPTVPIGPATVSTNPLRALSFASPEPIPPSRAVGDSTGGGGEAAAPAGDIVIAPGSTDRRISSPSGAVWRCGTSCRASVAARVAGSEDGRGTGADGCVAVEAVEAEESTEARMSAISFETGSLAGGTGIGFGSTPGVGCRMGGVAARACNGGDVDAAPGETGVGGDGDGVV